MSHSFQPHELQHTRLPCPSLSPRVCSNSHPLSWWCHPTISSSAVPFFSHLQSLPASGSFLMSQLFASGDRSIGASASASALPMIHIKSTILQYKIKKIFKRSKWVKSSACWTTRVEVESQSDCQSTGALWSLWNKCHFSGLRALNKTAVFCLFLMNIRNNYFLYHSFPSISLQYTCINWENIRIILVPCSLKECQQQNDEREPDFQICL